MDKITKSLLKDFLHSQEMKEGEETKDFELFCNYSVVSNEYSKTFDAQLVTVGKGLDTGIDGIAIIVNGHLVEDKDEISPLSEMNGYLEVTFLFIQSKTTSSFDTHDMHNFHVGIEDFFSQTPLLPRNEFIKKYAEIADCLFEKASLFRENPTCKIFYITTGIANPKDPNINATIKILTDSLKKKNLFENIKYNLIGANELGKIYRKTKNPTSATFTFLNKISLPEIQKVDQSFFGVIPFSEFKKILIDNNGNIQNLFDDNIRDFQGVKNVVNDSINLTLNSDHPDLFSVLNNGITIVANTITVSGNKFTITDYQIVNGCQTSNILYKNKNIKDIDDINIPLKIIATTDEDVKSKITVSTNNQTAVKKEQLTAMSDFQKNLQHFYNAISGDGKLFYERRAKEYNSNNNIIKRKIITIPNQIKSFSAMFNQNPHLVTTYLGKLIEKIGDPGSKIFEQDHQFIPYYMAGLALYRLDSLFNNGTIDNRYKKVRFYLLMLVPLIATKLDFPPLNSLKKCDKFCNPIIQKLNNIETCSTIFKTAKKIIDSSDVDVNDKEQLKARTMTDKILQTYKKSPYKV